MPMFVSITSRKAQLRAPLSPLQTALVEWNPLLTILAPGVWQTLCQSQCPCWGI